MTVPEATLTTGNMRRRRTLIVTAYLAGAIALLAEATSEYMLGPIQTELSLSTDATNQLGLIPDTAGFLAVFLAGVLAVRFGRRRLVTTGALIFVVGAITVGLAPDYWTLIAGRMLCGIGGVTLTVLGLSLISVLFTEPAHRARAFGVFGAIVPAVFIVTPPLAAWISDTLSWRYVTIAWFAVGATVLVLGLVSVPREQSLQQRQELVTPLLAGIALTAVCISATTLLESPAMAAAEAAVALAAGAALGIALRHGKSPSLDIRGLRAPGALWAAAAVALAFAVNISFYFGLYAQYRYDLPLARISMMFGLQEVAGIAGSLLFGAIAGRIGAPRAAILALLCVAATIPLIFTVTASSSIWAVVAVAVVVGVPMAGATGPLAQTFMNFAPADGSDGASSIYEALNNLGFVLGGLAVGFLAFSGFQRSFTDHLVEHGVAPVRASSIAADVRNGAVAAELVARDPVPEPGLAEVVNVEGAGFNQSQLDAMRIAGISLAVTDTLAAGTLVMSLRRRRRMPDASDRH